MMDIADIIKNPVKSKLLLEISRCKQTTAKHLAETFSDIPPATLYRYLKKMTSDGMLEVVRQTQIRGTTEKTYALAAGLRQELENMSTSGESYLLAFMQYMLGFAEQFQSYCGREEIDIQKDGSGFSTIPLYLSDQELEELVHSYQEIIARYQSNRAEKGKKLHSIGFIIAPPSID